MKENIINDVTKDITITRFFNTNFNVLKNK